MIHRRAFLRRVSATVGVAILAQPLSGCAVSGWPFTTPTAVPQPTNTPAPPTATARPTETPRPTSTPIPPTATARPTNTARPTSTPVPPTATPKPAVSSYTGAASIGNLIIKGKPETGIIACTYDAGLKDPGGTATVLDNLKAFGGKATFFLTGEWAEVNPALVKRMAAEGHELGNHTYDHPNLPEVADAVIVEQMQRTEAICQKITGAPLQKFMRPPFGAYDTRVLATLKGLGYEVIYWTVDSGDWRAEMTVQDVIERVGTKAGAGDIVVSHCYAPKTAQAVKAQFEALKARGLKLGTVSQVLGR